MIIWRASFLCGWWMILAHDHNRIHYPGPYDYMTSFLPLWMMDDSCSRSQQDSFPWTLLWLYDELPSFVDDGWFLLTTTNGFPLVINITSFLCGWWWMNLCSRPYTIPLVMIVTSFFCGWWMNLTHQQTTTGVLVNQQPPAHYVGWMVCAQKNSFPLYSCINIAIHGPKWTSTH